MNWHSVPLFTQPNEVSVYSSEETVRVMVHGVSPEGGRDYGGKDL